MPRPLPDPVKTIGVLVFLAASSLQAQSAASVRAASIAFLAQSESSHASPIEQREASRLARQAEAEARAGDLAEATRSYAHATAMIGELPWTPVTEFAASLEARIGHVMLEPGEAATVWVAQVYRSQGSLSVSVFLVGGRSGNPDRELIPSMRVDSSRLPLAARFVMPNLPAGNYDLAFPLAAADASLDAPPRGPFLKTLPVHVERLSEDVQALRGRLQANRPSCPGLAAAEYALELFTRIDHGQESLRPYSSTPFHRELAEAAVLLDAVDAGRDPFARRHGDFRRVYRSQVDHSLQPYRIFVPSRYDGHARVPLVVALHGAGGNENDFFDNYPQAPLQREAERLGFIVVCPRGREPRSGYRGAAEQDVVDVMTEVKRQYDIDPDRVYLMGHSMGAYATWRLAMEHPDWFAALGPISGGGDPTGMARIRDIPEYVVHGAEDRTVPVSESRRMVEKGREVHAHIVYVEVPGAGHYDAAIGQFGPMLDFFARQKRQPQ